MTGATVPSISAIQCLSNDLRLGDAALPRPMFEQPLVALFDVDLFADHTSEYTSPKSWPDEPRTPNLRPDGPEVARKQTYPSGTGHAFAGGSVG